MSSKPSQNLISRPDGTLTVVTGASRTGKTSWVVERVKRSRRLLVWDSVGEWADRFNCERIRSINELSRAVFRRGRFAFDVPCTSANFDAFCRAAWIYIRAQHATLVVEELADVTSPGKAPIYWGEVLRKGLRYGPDIYALTQRPSESDKTVMGNASILHVHQMAREEDSRYMARELRCEAGQVDALGPFEWIERGRRTRQLTVGRLPARGFTMRKSARGTPNT